MILKFIYGNYLKYNKGIGFISCYVDVFYVELFVVDLFMDKIVENLVKKIGCVGIVSMIFRIIVDLNRNLNEINYEGIYEYRSIIKEIVKFLKIIDSNNFFLIFYLYLFFYGMKDIYYGFYVIEVGILYG